MPERKGHVETWEEKMRKVSKSFVNEIKVKKRAIDPLELEFQMAVLHLVLGMEPRYPGKVAVFLFTEP